MAKKGKRKFGVGLVFRENEEAMCHLLLKHKNENISVPLFRNFDAEKFDPLYTFIPCEEDKYYKDKGIEEVGVWIDGNRVYAGIIYQGKEFFYRLRRKTPEKIIYYTNFAPSWADFWERSSDLPLDSPLILPYDLIYMGSREDRWLFSYDTQVYALKADPNTEELTLDCYEGIGNIVSSPPRQGMQVSPTDKSNLKISLSINEGIRSKNSLIIHNEDIKVSLKENLSFKPEDPDLIFNAGSKFYEKTGLEWVGVWFGTISASVQMIYKGKRFLFNLLRYTPELVTYYSNYTPSWKIKNSSSQSTKDFKAGIITNFPFNLTYYGYGKKKWYFIHQSRVYILSVDENTGRLVLDLDTLEDVISKYWERSAQRRGK